MKKLLFGIFLMSIPFLSFEQTGNTNVPDTLPAYKKNSHLPTFSILTIDSTTYTNANLPAGKPVIIIYFSPECGHCQYELGEIAKKMDSANLTRAQFVLVSFHPIPDLKKFAATYGLTKFPNIVLGRDPKYFIPSFFRVEFTPYVAIYSPVREFAGEFRMGAKPQELSEVLDKFGGHSH